MSTSLLTRENLVKNIQNSKNLRSSLKTINPNPAAPPLHKAADAARAGLWAAGGWGLGAGI
tara:strand:+ start:639 stop:821 length:183 start_codon:yes stop_codon:yes gene_type:complete